MKYGGDPTKYQLRDMNRRITSLEKARLRSDTRIRSLQHALGVAREDAALYKALVKALEDKI